MKGVGALLCVVLLLPGLAAALVDINTADLTALETLNGIGPSKAQAILDYRTQNGPFAKIDDITNVSGIGATTYSNIKDSITVDDQSASQTQQSDTEEPTAQSTSTPTQSQASTTLAPTPSYVPPPQPELFVDGGADRTVIVGADTEFDGRAYNVEQILLEKARYIWNFGDGTTGEGPAVLHHYDYPGRYAVILTAAADKESEADEIIATAEPAQLSFIVNPDESVSIENRAVHDLDLSGWIVRAGLQSFTLPEHSVILKGQALRISQKTLRFIATSQTEFDYPNGVVALHANESSGTAPAVQNTAAAPVAASVVPPPHSVVSALKLQTAEAADEVGAEVVEAHTLPMQSAAAALPAFSYWWLGLGALIASGIGAVLYIRRIKAGEWDIDEA